MVKDEEAAQSKAQLYRFLEWQQEVRESRAMLLEDMKAAARRRGEDDSLVTLPHKSYVSYSRTTVDKLAASADLKRTLIRAEAAALRMSKGLTMMDLDAAALDASGSDESEAMADVSDALPAALVPDLDELDQLD